MPTGFLASLQNHKIIFVIYLKKVTVYGKATNLEKLLGKYEGIISWNISSHTRYSNCEGIKNT